MPSIDYNITITEGQLTCATKRQAGNYIESLDYIPGSTLRGVFAGFLINNLNNDFEKHCGLFMSNQVAFSNAYPIERNAECIPVPLSYFTCKDYPGIVGRTEESGHRVYNFSMTDKDKCDCGVELKSMSGFIYYDSDNGKFYPYSREKLVLPGNKIDDSSQSAGKGDGEVFFVESIPAPAKFYSRINFLDNDIQTEFCNLFGSIFNDAEIFLGKKKNACAELGITRENPDINEIFDGMNNETTERVCIYCFSDMILVDDFLNYQPCITKEAIVKACCGKDWIDRLEIIPDKAYVRNDTVGGFNNTLGFPLIQDQIIEKGSVNIFNVKGIKADIERLKVHLVQRGMGLRRNEGFGRIVINHPYLNQEEYNIQ